MENCDIREATHVKLSNGQVEKIVSKYGVGGDGHLAKPSQGGFGGKTETGASFSMWDARSYFKEGKS